MEPEEIISITLEEETEESVYTSLEIDEVIGQDSSQVYTSVTRDFVDRASLDFSESLETGSNWRLLNGVTIQGIDSKKNNETCSNTNR